ncbi:hypothetical protein Tco_0678093 [Tanacetum coccineum]|uniref:Uncharacterized protein n=1 Tax=Tanacetum coccineum TaxID=301880 RepID=A0ABQ4XE07_9ASTR
MNGICMRLEEVQIQQFLAKGTTLVLQIIEIPKRSPRGWFKTVGKIGNGDLPKMFFYMEHTSFNLDTEVVFPVTLDSNLSQLPMGIKCLL